MYDYTNKQFTVIKMLFLVIAVWINVIRQLNFNTELINPILLDLERCNAAGIYLVCPNLVCCYSIFQTIS